MPLFERYLFADYSGGKRDHHAQSNIRLYKVDHEDDVPHRVYRNQVNKRTGIPLNYSRNSLREQVRSELDQSNIEGKRVIFGQDHQYGWPPHLRELAALTNLSWRDAIQRLADGDDRDGLPPLAPPEDYCRQFNESCGKQVFWTPLRGKAALYGIANQAHPDYVLPQRFRLTELEPPMQGNHQPRSADAVGGIGHGVVGGQTICGLRQISHMLEWDDVAWWPFDGLDVNGEAYRERHVAIEIYPSALRPADIVQNDDNDADFSCRYIRDADKENRLQSLLCLSMLKAQFTDQVKAEGWIVGMDPQNLLLSG